MELSSPLLTLTLDLAHTSLRLSTTTAPIPCTPLLRLRLVLGNIRDVEGRSSLVGDKENYCSPEHVLHILTVCRIGSVNNTRLYKAVIIILVWILFINIE